MKRLFKILLGFMVVALIIYGCNQRSGQKLQLETEKTREELRRTGYRTDLSEFNLAVTDEVRRRAEAVIAAGQGLRELRAIGELELMRPIGTNVALRTVPLEKITPRYPLYGETNPDQDLWALLEAEFGKCRSELDAASQALLAGEFRFEPQEKGGNFLLPYLVDVKKLAMAFTECAVLRLHQRRPDEAFTNLLTLTRLITAWQPEAIEISHLVRFACVGIARRALWETTQTEGLSQVQYLALQREWEAMRVFDGLADTAALSRAGMVKVCQLTREGSFADDVGPWGEAFAQMGRTLFSSPLRSVQELWWRTQAYQQHSSYRRMGSYEDETALLLYFRERELEIRQALTCTNWQQMRALPGVTNLVVFQGAKQSRIGAMMNLRLMQGSFASEGRRLLARAAETEALRRVMVTTLALEQYFLQHSNYPASLDELVPKYLASMPVDFMDGRELRYRLSLDGRCLLYSLGLDGVDNGGQHVTPESLHGIGLMFGDRVEMMRPPTDTDLVWPLPATQEDVGRYEKILVEKEAEYDAMRKQMNDEMPVPIDSEMERAFRARYGTPGETESDEVPTNRPPLPSPARTE